MRLKAAADWLFYALYRFDLGFSGRELREWKALLGVTVLQGFLLMSVALWLEMYAGLPLLRDAGKVSIWLGGLGLVLANHWLFMRHGRAKNIVEACSRHPPGARRIRMAAAYASVLVVFAALFASFWVFAAWATAKRVG